MKRAIFAFILGLAGWVLVASLLDRGLRLTMDGYAAAEPQMVFTLAMKAARLALAAIASVAAGAIVRAIRPTERRVALILGLAILVAFLPLHVTLWNRFPAWYHLTFLLSIVPCVLLGAWLAGRRGPAPA